MHAISDSFREAIARAGLTPPAEILADGTLHRFSTNGRKDDDAGWYVFHDDGVPAGCFGDWRSGITQTWCNKSDRQLTPAERAEYRRRIEQVRRERDKEEQRRHADAADEARRLWDAANPSSPHHPYLVHKNIKPHGLRVDAENRLLVTVSIDGVLTSLQFIDAEGTKQFLPGGAIKGGCCVIGDLTGVNPILLGEGYATMASIHEATGLPTIVAFHAGNLKPVAEAFRQQFPHRTIGVCADDDAWSPGNPGLTKAHEAAETIGGVVAVPVFGDGRPSHATDFNDLLCWQGAAAVRKAIAAVLPLHIFDEIHAFLGRFIAYPSEHAHVAHTLWIGHTHLMDRWESTPRLAALSPEPSSGKTRLMEVTETLVPRPVSAIDTTPAYLFRKVSDPAGLPTILYDEIDTIFGPRAKEHEEIRCLINAGHRRGAMAGRCVTKGKQIEMQDFPAYCAVALAGLGNLPDTILTRSVVLAMRRRAPHEQVEPYRRRLHAPQGEQLRTRLAEWAAHISPTLNTCPDMPQGIADRDADVWESLLAVAHAAGGDWPERARVAAVTLVTCSMRDKGSLGVRLLEDLRTVFGDREVLATAEILETLIGLEESPWGDLRGKPLDGRRLSKLLKPYAIAPKVLRIGTGTYRGYERVDLQDAWIRYLPPKEESLLSPSHTVHVTSVTPETPDQDELFLEEEPNAD